MNNNVTDCMLVIDTGTSSIRGIIFDSFGNLLAKYQIGYNPHVSGKAVTQSPSDFTDGLIKICRYVALYCEDACCSLKGIALTSQRSSVVPVDFSGSPLDDVMMWQDTRAKSVYQNWDADKTRKLFEISGMRLSCVLSAPKMRWIKLNKPHTYLKSYKLLSIHDFLLHYLTGNYITDSSLACRTGLMNIRTFKWSNELLNLFGISSDKLVEIVSPGSHVGNLTISFSKKTGLKSGIPVVSSGGDQQCSVLGQGLNETGKVSITCGTGAYLATLTNQPVCDQKYRLNLCASVQPNSWIIEANTMSAGIAHNWFNANFYFRQNQSYPFEDIDRDLVSTPPGANGVLMLPSLAGRGCPHWSESASGVFYNLRLNSTRADCARALVEGIACEIANCYAAITPSLQKECLVAITGGLSKSDAFVQVISDMLNRPVRRCDTAESTAVGAYLSAFATIFPEQSVPVCNNKKIDTFFPQEKVSRLYKDILSAHNLLSSSIPDDKLAAFLQ